MIPAVNRHKRILEQLQTTGLIRVAELSRAFDVTEKTIREDLEKLESKGLLKRIHGGAIPLYDAQQTILPDGLSNTYMLEEKRQIAAYAIKLIQPHDIIALDAGSTTLEMARLLPNEPLTVITNDVLLIRELALKEHILLVVPGGYRHMNVLIKNEQADWVRKLNIHKLFLSTMGVHLEDGFTIFTEEHADMKKTLVQTAREVYCVTDHTKFDKSALFTFAALQEADKIITDSGLSPEIRSRYEASGVRIEQVPAEKQTPIHEGG